MTPFPMRRFLPAVAGIWAGLSLASAAGADDMAATLRRVQILEGQVADAGAGLRRIQTAQLFNRPPEEIPNAEGDDYGRPVGRASDAAGLDVRVDRLENQMRTLNGQIEQTQFEIRRLEDQLKKFQQDVDLRLQDGRTSTRPGPQKRADALDPPTALPDYPPTATPPAAPSGPTPLPSTSGLTGRVKRGDAFDPQAQPNAPGAPRTLGSLPAGPLPAPTPPVEAGPPPEGRAPLGTDPSGPLDLSRGAGAVPGTRPPVEALPGPGAIAATGPEAGVVAPGGAVIAPGPGGGPREDFDLAFSFLKQGEYETAQTSFEAFIQKYPKDRLVPDAVFYLGESFFQRGRHREAAEQFLKVATDYSKSARAPDGLVRLGMSLNAIGAKEQACATFGEVSRKYPNASVTVRASVDREIKRAKC